MTRRAIRELGARAWMLVVAAAVACNAISGIDDFTASDPSGGSSADGGASGSAGSAATSGAATGGSATGGSATGGSATGGSAGVGGGNDGSAGAEADAAGGEQCANAVDDDSDTRVDCFDSDCRDHAACAGFCSDAETLPCNAIRRAQSSSAPGSTARIAPPFYACGGLDQPGPEYAYRLQVAEGKQVFVELFELDANLVVHAIDAANGGPCDAKSSCLAAGASASGMLAEALSFASSAGRDYYIVVDGPAAGAYSISIQCSEPDGCIPARAIEAGQTLTGSLVLGSAPNVTDKLGAYSCQAGNRDAPEAAFMFSPTADGDYRIDLTQLSTNADLFVVAAPNCNAICLSPTSKSTNTSSSNESIVLAATAGTTYYIVVDAYVSSGFTLSVTKL